MKMGIHLFLSLQLASYILKLVTHNLSTERRQRVKIAIIGTGYVGLVTGTCLSDFGLSVTCVDQDEQEIKMLNSGGVPIYEPNLEDLIQKNVSADRLIFTTDLGKAVKESKVIFITVGTPSDDDGSANLKQIETVAQQIACYLNDYKVIVNKSTVPIGTAAKIKEIINKYQSMSVIPAKAGIHPSVIARSEATKQSDSYQSAPYLYNNDTNAVFYLKKTGEEPPCTRHREGPRTFYPRSRHTGAT